MSARPPGQGFDLLRFFIMMMVVLTTIVACFGVLLWTRYSEQQGKLKREVSNLENMKQFAEKDEQLREWILLERKARKDPKKVAQLQSFIISLLNKRGLDLKNFQPQRPRPVGAFNEASFQVSIDDIDMKQLTDFLFDCQNEWPGLKVKDVVATRDPKDDRLWRKATITLTLFSPRRAEN